jgi:hypothetical protein
VLLRAAFALAVTLWALVLVGSAPSMAADPVSPPNPWDFDCTLPALPHGIAGSTSRSATLSGPAVTALRGGPARHSFSLDGRALIVEPPRHKRPVLAAKQALCGAMQSTGGLSGFASQGVAVGYGEVSVAKRFFPAITGFPGPGENAAKFPMVASFHDRLAWLVVVHSPPSTFNCPEESAPVRLVPRPSDHDYKVFLIDARTGNDALVYTEGGPGGCTNGARVPPSVAVAEESVSVPWTLVSRDPDGYSGTIAATVFPCDQVPGTVLLDAGGPDVVVEVTRPYGAACGATETVLIALHAAEVTEDLPAAIGHDPVGLTNMLSFREPGTPPPTTTTTATPALVQVPSSDNGQTVTLMVGEVVALQPLPGAEGDSLASPAVSSDPAVLGPLTSNPQPLDAEFRAWKQGVADISVPQSACIHPGSNQVPCNGPFVLHVVVR